MILRPKHVGAILNVFSVEKKYIYECALVGVLIKWLYEMHGATIKIITTVLIWNIIKYDNL